MLTRRDGLCLTIAALLLGTGLPGRRLSAQESDQADEPRLALKGYDPVAYFTEGRPTLGKAEFEYIWDEVRYRFASDRHMSLFRGDPDRYAPQFAGSCAAAVALGVKIEANPRNWLISDGRLFVFAGEGATASFPTHEIAAADKNWQRLKDAPFGADLRQ
jgi:hypothetical protein